MPKNTASDSKNMIEEDFTGFPYSNPRQVVWIRWLKIWK